MKNFKLITNMGMSNKVTFLLVTTCVLMHFIGTVNASRRMRDILQEREQSIDEKQLGFDSLTLPINILNDHVEVSATITTISPEITTATINNTALINNVTENVQNNTVRAGKSLKNYLTVNPRNNTDIIDTQELNSGQIIEHSVPEISLSLKELSLANEKKLESVISTNVEENSILINSPQNYSEFKPKPHIEYQQTGEDLEESIKKAVRDEILLETPIDQKAVEVVNNIPDAELRDEVARDLLGDDYIRHSELTGSLLGGEVNVK